MLIICSFTAATARQYRDIFDKLDAQGFLLPPKPKKAAPDDGVESAGDGGAQDPESEGELSSYPERDQDQDELGDSGPSESSEFYGGRVERVSVVVK